VKKVIVLNKKEGETPLEALDNFRIKNKEYKNIPMTYAGRLDPMASGVLVILSGEETKNKEKYLNLDKEYEFEVLFGFSTDTHDILGKVISPRPDLGEGIDLPTRPGLVGTGLVGSEQELVKKIKDNIKSFLGESMQSYPMYSSKTVKGKPLFTYARSGEVVDIPERKIFIKKIKLIKIRKMSSKNLLQNIEKRIKKVKGDFRQEDILEAWRRTLSFPQGRTLGKRGEYFYVASFKTNCSSGTYVRVLSDSLGKALTIPSLAYSIRRTKVGKYVI
jgi:tRNA pseudouridine55 synthase